MNLDSYLSNLVLESETRIRGEKFEVIEKKSHDTNFIKNGVTKKVDQLTTDKEGNTIFSKTEYSEEGLTTRKILFYKDRMLFKKYIFHPDKTIVVFKNRMRISGVCTREGKFDQLISISFDEKSKLSGVYTYNVLQGNAIFQHHNGESSSSAFINQTFAAILKNVEVDAGDIGSYFPPKI